jgi:hypothetical protein
VLSSQVQAWLKRSMLVIAIRVSAGCTKLCHITLVYLVSRSILDES